jgi:hypothetical protein
MCIVPGAWTVQALMDEKAAPDVLEFKDDILKAVSDMVKAQVCLEFVHREKRDVLGTAS